MLRRKTAILASVLTAVTVIGAGAAFGTPGDSSSSSTGTTSTTTALPDASGGEAFAYEVGDAGTITVESDGTGLAITAVTASDGWAAEVEIAQGREVEADFRTGDRRIQFNAELEDGQIRVRVRERVGDERTEDVTFTGLSNSTTTVPTTAAVTSVADSTTTYSAGEAGTVTIALDSSGLTVVSVDPVEGWSTEIEVAAGREVEVDFRIEMRRIQFNAELEDGEVRIRVRDRVDADDDDNSGSGNADDLDDEEDENDDD